MRYRGLTRFVVLGVVVLLAACNNITPNSPNEQNDELTRGFNPGTIDSSGGVLFSTAKGKGSNSNSSSPSGIGVNAYLWRGALDTLSFMPLASADPFGGVIITDWYQPPSVTGERFKATAYILGRELRADGVRIALFRQVQQNGEWVDAPVAPATSSQVEDKILARARELRAAATAVN
jgi:hypothetical protein